MTSSEIAILQVLIIIEVLAKDINEKEYYIQIIIDNITQANLLICFTNFLISQSRIIAFDIKNNIDELGNEHKIDSSSFDDI